jgi:hypothetical protein
MTAAQMDAHRYLREIVDPTIAEFENDQLSVRVALIACVMTFHAIDYLEGSRQNFRRESGDFSLIDRIAHAAKHRQTDGREALKAQDIVTRPPAIWGQAVFDLSRWDDAIGGVTVGFALWGEPHDIFEDRA